MVKKRPLIIIAILIFLLWNIFTYFLLASRQPNEDMEEAKLFLALKVNDFRKELKKQAMEHSTIYQRLMKAKELLDYPMHLFDKTKSTEASRSTYGKSAPVNLEELHSNKSLTRYKATPLPRHAGIAIAVLVMACDRPTVSRTLDEILRYRPSAVHFPVIVSQDCGHESTAIAIESYAEELTHIKHPDLSNIILPKKEEKFKGYHKIARHYKWALNQVFNSLNYTAAIVVEDDLEISSDFYEYFSATYPILTSDPTLWCVSAWNDNGKKNLVADEPELLYRTDFFPGLGWMLESQTWQELKDKWPKTFWDDWMREPKQRRNRSCIRPEISRTSTFGKIGVSKGQFFEKHLKFIQHNDKFVPFTKMNLTYLKKAEYDKTFVESVYGYRLSTLSQLTIVAREKDPKPIRIEYENKEDFKRKAKHLGIMDDLKAGVPRTGYMGIVSLMYGGQRVFLAPTQNWTGYEESLWV